MTSQTTPLPADSTAPVPPSPGAETPQGTATGPTAPGAPVSGAPTSGAPIPPTPTGPALESRSLGAPLTVLAAIAHLAFLGAYGTAVFTTLGVLLGVGVGLSFLIVGLPLLLAFVYLTYAVAFLETARVEGLYRFGLPMLRPRRSPKRGFVGFLHTVWLQFVDGGMWRAIAHLAIATILGGLVWFLAMTTVSSTVAAFAPLWGGTVRTFGFTVPGLYAPVAAAVVALLALAAIVGIALLHGVLSRLLVAPIREAQLASEAKAAAQRAQSAAAEAENAATQRAGAIRASEVERTRIERDLHDGVQPRLVSVGMTLGLAQQKIDTEPDKAKDLVAEAHTSTKAAITELRQLARGIHASVLDDRGLDAALSALAGRSHIPVHLDVRIQGSPGRDAEAAVYFAVAESLTNAAKHSRATEARVVIRSRQGDGAQDQLWARVEDDGMGGARIVPGGGLDGIRNRITAIGGTFRLDSPAGGPTSLEVSVPCAS